jgi:hypothetical protein
MELHARSDFIAGLFGIRRARVDAIFNYQQQHVKREKKYTSLEQKQRELHHTAFEFITNFLT